MQNIKESDEILNSDLTGLVMVGDDDQTHIMAASTKVIYKGPAINKQKKVD